MAPEGTQVSWFSR